MGRNNLGTEAVWIPLVAAALGTATTVYSQKQAANKQDDQLSAQLSRQRNQQKQADARRAAHRLAGQADRY